MIKRLLLGVAVLVTFSTTSLRAQPGTFPTDSLSERVAREFVKAFGERDIDGMVKVMDPRMLWMVVWGDSINMVAARGRDSLEARLRREAGAARPASTTTIESLIASGPWISAKIKSASKTPTGESSSAWVYVMEVRGGVILRLWQYPSWVSASTSLPGK